VRVGGKYALVGEQIRIGGLRNQTEKDRFEGGLWRPEKRQRDYTAEQGPRVMG
jgi:hypothetical protein